MRAAVVACWVAVVLGRQLFIRDEEGAMLAFEDMMRKQIVMPAHLMDDTVHFDPIIVPT